MLSTCYADNMQTVMNKGLEMCFGTLFVLELYIGTLFELVMYRKLYVYGMLEMLTGELDLL